MLSFNLILQYTVLLF